MNEFCVCFGGSGYGYTLGEWKLGAETRSEVSSSGDLSNGCK